MTSAARDATAPHPLASPGFRRDPHGVYRALRERQAVLCRREPDGRPVECLLLRHAEVDAALRDERFSANRLRSERFRRSLEDVPEDLHPRSQGPSMLTVDPPHHTRLRRLVGRAFTPRRVEALAPRIEELVHERLDLASRAGGMDVIRDLAEPVPAIVIAELLGVPPEDHRRFRAWSKDLLGGLVGRDPDAHLAGFRSARDELEAYLAAIADARRREPRDDLITGLVLAEEERDALTREELIATCTLLLVAGHETTTNLIGNGAWLLAGARDAREAVRREPARAAAAVEEVLRLESPFQALARITAEDLEIGGEALPAGTLVTAVLGAANRDPRVFADPDRLDLERRPNPHLAFGAGIHFCLGAGLARLEGCIALGALCERFPRLAPIEDGPSWRSSHVLRGLARLPVRV